MLPAPVPIAISDISDPGQIRVKLLASGQEVHAPMSAFAAASIHGAAPKATPADTDEFGYWDSVGLQTVKATWANLKATLFAAFTFTTSATGPKLIGGTGTASSLALQSTSGVGATDFINFLVGNNGATEAARFNTSGQLGIGTTAPTSKLTVNNNTVALPAAISGTSVHIGGADSVQTRLLFDGFGSNGNFSFRAALGTAASRSALTTNTIIGSIAGFGAYDATNYTTTGRVTITYNAAENWSSTNQGTHLQIFTTLNGTTSQRAVATFGNDGLLTLLGALATAAPVTKSADFTLAATESSVINAKASACVMTLPAASTCPGRELDVNNEVAQTLVSASSNVVPKAGGAAGTAILPATAGAWARLKSNGTNWKIMWSGT